MSATSTLIQDLNFCAIDFESAGAARGHTDVPIQIGLAWWSAPLGLTAPFTSYLSTEKKVTWAAQKVHGISDADLLNAPTMLALWPEFKNRMQGRVIVAHGKGTEKKFLRSFPGHGFGPWIDTLLLARAIWPDWPDHNLGNICLRLGLEEIILQHCPGKTWHDALFDAIASLCLWEWICKHYHLNHHPLSQFLQPKKEDWSRL